MTIHIIPFAVAIIGLVLYLATDAKPSEAGRLAFAIGLAVLVWMYRGVG